MINVVFQIFLSFITAGLIDCFLHIQYMEGKPVFGSLTHIPFPKDEVITESFDYYCFHHHHCNSHNLLTDQFP